MISTEQQFEFLIQEVRKYMLEHQAAEQVIVVKTAKGNVRFFANNVLDQKYVEEKEFVRKLVEQDDTVIQYIVCMWNDESLDLPSMNFRKLLLEVNEENKYAEIYLGNGVKEIWKCMPQNWLNEKIDFVYIQK